MTQLALGIKGHAVGTKGFSSSNYSIDELRENVTFLACRITDLEKEITAAKDLWLDRWMDQLLLSDDSRTHEAKKTLLLFAERPAWFQFVLANIIWVWPLTDDKRSISSELHLRPNVVAPPVFGDYLSATTIAALENIEFETGGEEACLKHRAKFERGDFLEIEARTFDELLVAQVTNLTGGAIDEGPAADIFEKLIEAQNNEIPKPGTQGYRVLSVLLVAILLEHPQVEVTAILQVLVARLEDDKRLGRPSRDIELVSGEIVLIEADKAMKEHTVFDLIWRLKRGMKRLGDLKLDFS